MNRGLSKPSLFVFEITSGEQSRYFGANEYLKFFCKSTALPEITQDTVNSNGHFRQGVVTQQPIGFRYSKPLVINVIERSDYHVYSNIRRWLNRTARMSNAESGAQMMRYRDDYCADILLHKLENPTRGSGNQEPMNIDNEKFELMDNFRVVWTAKFINSYPTSIGTINYGQDLRDSFTEYPIEFNYDTYTIEFSDGSVVPDDKESF